MYRGMFSTLSRLSRSRKGLYVIAESVLYQPSTMSLASVILCERKT